MDHSFEVVLEQFEPLIKSEIKKLNKFELYDELYQVGLIALWEAKANFQTGKGMFPSYAKLYIRGKLLNFLKRERTYHERYQMFQLAEFIENVPDKEYIEPTPFPVEQIKTLLTPKELTWFIEFYENNKKPGAIAKQYQVSVDQVKNWRKSALKKMQKSLKRSELLEML